MNVFDKIIDVNVKNDTGLINLTGGFFVLFLKKLFSTSKKSILVVSSSNYEARKIYNKFNNDSNVVLFESDEFDFSDDSFLSPELRIDRINTLNELVSNSKKVVLTDMRGYLKRLQDISSYKKRNINLNKGNSISRDEIVSKFEEFGYSRNSVVEKMGDYAFRGFVLDIFPVNSDNPIRIEFFGDGIDDIKEFDLDSQRSNKTLDKAFILPFNEKREGNSSIYEYLNNPIVIFKDYNQIKFSYEKMVSDSLEDNILKYYFDFDSIKPEKRLYYFNVDSPFDENLSEIKDYNTFTVPFFRENFNDINKYVKEISSRKTVVICTGTNNFNAFLEKLDFSYVLTDFNNIYEGKINIVREKFAEGFENKDYVFLTDYELFGRSMVSTKKSRFKNSSKIRDLSKIEIGDYVVHSLYGIGIYNGIRVLSKNGSLSDYLEILYAKGDKLYIPASKIELIGKYNGKDGYVPKINALNSLSWFKAKNRIREKIKYEAERLIKVQAEREVKKGFAFSKDSPMQNMFEDEFVYEITPDQDRAVKEIKEDMENIVPMDRILCGDVGYGKTEVAFRAMFKAAMDSKQVLYLCPTTLLCRQQYEVAIERFKNYPVNIAVLNRFVSNKEIKRTLEDLKNGKIDIIFGTHRALSDDVIFNDLGLLVVDEEQRFGVAQKEKIKEMKSNIDVLTLTATPIPRTLQMAVLGIKNLSLIETPPKNRKSVVTYVTPFSKKLIREVIYKEVSRGGQVFILYNRVEDIERKASFIKELVPDVRVCFAHGQMDKNSFEEVMDDFVSKKYDVLVCTTIIETGVDIPNVNSLIILDADRFGLSQLYQIRGRVGRSDVLSYAYLMYEKGKVLTEKSLKRLKVIKDFTELGSGFAIATKDLSIRGAGDILGSEQAGFIDTVGMDLYLKMLNEEVERLKGMEVPLEKEEDSNLTINVSSHIKDSYVSDEDVKIEIHKMINSIKDEKSLNSVKKTIEDRFGPVDDELFVYMNEQLFENLTKNLGIIKVFDNNKYREITFDKEKSLNINYEDFFVKAISINKNFNFSYKNKFLSIKLLYSDSKKHVVFDFNKLLKELE